MRIAIDAKSFYSGPISTRIILKNLVPELIKLYPEIHWVIFLDKKDKSFGFPYIGENVYIKYVWAGINQLSNLFVLPRYYRKLDIDLVVYQTFPAITPGTPSIAFIHDVLFKEFPEFFTWKEKLYFASLSFLIPRITRVIATTDFVAKDLIKYKYVDNPSLIDIVPLGVSPEFKPVEQQNQLFIESIKGNLKLPGRFILFVGRLNVRKNLENLLKALPLIEDKAIPLVIVGKEEWKTPQLEVIMSNPAIGKRVIMTGGISDQELTAVYSIATIFCFPSFAEGFGLPPLEAMASGVPVIVANTTSLPEVCGDAATYVNPADPSDIATAINRLLSNPVLYKEKKQAGMSRSLQFTWKNTAIAFRKSIDNALQQYKR